VSAAAKAALSVRDIPLGLTALSPFKGGIPRLLLTDYNVVNYLIDKTHRRIYKIS
jgi:hypothetical protein